MEKFEISVKRFNDFASEYAKRFMNIDSYQKHFEEFSNMIEKQQPKILELACGPGNVTRFLKKKFPESELIAIDLAPRMIELASQTVEGVDFRLMDVRNIKSLNLKFDAIMCSFCLPFLSKSDTDKLISDCSDMLIENGVLYLSTMEGDETEAGFETTSFSGEAEVYFNFHRQQDLVKSSINSGFSVDYNIKQNCYEPDGSITIDLIIIAKKKH